MKAAKKMTSHVSYRESREKFSPVAGDIELLKKETYVPISIAASQSAYSEQAIRLFCLSGQIRTMKFHVGPLMVRLDDIPAQK